MAPKPHPRPTAKELEPHKGKYDSRAKLAAALGIGKSTFNTWYANDPELAKLIDETLAAPRREPLEASVDDPERLKAVQIDTELKELRRRDKEYEKALLSQEEFFNRILEATRQPVKTPRYKKVKQQRHEHHQSIIAPIFDQQFGQFVRPTDTPGNRGGYSVSIFDERLAMWVDKTCKMIRNRAYAYTIDELIIPFGGDHVEGDEIFAGQAWQLALDPCQQVWELSVKMDSAIKEIVRFAKEEVGIPFIACYGVDDNHGKVGGKRSGARPATYSWNWLFLKILFENHLREEPIDQLAIEPGGSLFFRCAGHEFQLIHGHQVRGWGGIPFYGLTRFDGRSIRMHNRIYRYLLMGHHHQVGEIPNGAGETIISGDWVGPNNLSGQITAGSRPQQKVLYVSPERGIDGHDRIYFEDADEAYHETAIYGREAA
jgi:hypothetical protein